VSLPVAVFASGGGSNLQSIIDRCPADTARVTVVISDRADAGALLRAERAGIPGVHIPVRGRSTDEVTADTLDALRRHDVQLIALAGYLRLVPAALIAAYPQRMLNIHPALLPAFGGAGMYGSRVHEAVIAAASRVSGATVHWVDEHYDEGGIVAQWPVPVFPGDDAATLGARVLRLEHVLYPTVIAAVARRLSGRETAGTGDPAMLDTFRLGGSARDLEDGIRCLVAT
jgi:phosphoribosylglycinamide formyltransferase 1